MSAAQSTGAPATAQSRPPSPEWTSAGIGPVDRVDLAVPGGASAGTPAGTAAFGGAAGAAGGGAEPQHQLADLFTATRAEGRAALVGYLPAGYPDTDTSVALFRGMIEGGCDLVEVGMPFSDPVLDGPVIQDAQQASLAGGFSARSLISVVEKVTAAGGRAVVMTYFNPVLAYGVDAFARDLASAGGAGVITPDLIVDEAGPWRAAMDAAGLAPIFLVAPSTGPERIALTAGATRGFLYAASTMGVTGARDQVSSAAPELVARCRELTDLPIGVGLGVRTGRQAGQIASFADAVIVGSAFVTAAKAAGGRAVDAVRAVATLAEELADGVRHPTATRPVNPPAADHTGGPA